MVIKMKTYEEYAKNETQMMENYEELAEATGKAVIKAAVDGEKAMEDGCVNTYKGIENSTVSAYKSIESHVVGAYKKIEDSFVDKYLTHEGESVEDAKERLSRKTK